MAQQSGTDRKRATRKTEAPEERFVIDWHGEFAEPFATIGVEIAEELHRVALEGRLDAAGAWVSRETPEFRAAANGH